MKKNSDESAQSKVELQADGKKPKASSVKSQLAAYKKELNETKEEIERVKKALESISDIRSACLENLISVRKGVHSSTLINSFKY